MRRLGCATVLGLLVPARSVLAHEMGIPHTHDPNVKAIIAGFVIAGFVLAIATVALVRARRDNNA